MGLGQRLLARLDEIGASLARTGHALALIGLGSVGLETARVDAFSDLDFFAIVEPAFKQPFIANLDWLATAAPIAYAYQNTVDGCKVLYADGIFCEYAVFAPEELSRIPFARGRIVWKRPEVPETIAIPTWASPPAAHGRDWLLGEALTNLYVGLCRDRRGERLAGARLVQGHAVDRALELAALDAPETAAPRDPFANERRFEARYPGLAAELPRFMQGYTRNRESALALLAFLESRCPVNAAMAAAIRALCTGEDMG